MANQKRVSIAGAARRALADDKRARKMMDEAKRGLIRKRKLFEDTFQNFPFQYGIGTTSPLTSASYGFNPITRNRILLEWAHRGNWIAGVAVDLKAEDMTREGVTLKGELDPDSIQKVEEAAVSLKIWEHLKQTVQWARLYGGSLAFMLIDGQDPETELRVETIDKGQFKGLLPLDRWMVTPDLRNLVTQPGPELGLPKFYEILPNSTALPNIKIHHSRCLRLIGIDLPHQQRIMENLWGISVLERLWDRMVAFDSATHGAAQLVYKAYVRYIKIKDLRDIVAGGGKAFQGLMNVVEAMRSLQSQEGITLLDTEDELEAMAQPSFSGLSDSLIQFGQQLSGALQIPLVRLFGQSPVGLNSSGESDLRTYYDGIRKDQKAELGPGVTKMYRAIARSEGVDLPEGFSVDFRSLHQLTEKEKSEVAEQDVRAITAAEDGGIISQRTAMMELKQSSAVTGRFSNITQEDIDSAEVELPPAGTEALELAAKAAQEIGKGEESEAKAAEPGGGATKDSSVTASMKKLHDLNVSIENIKGSIRRGKDWAVKMPAHYGYLSSTNGRDGEEIDCYVGPQMDSQNVWLFKTLNPETRDEDEHKVMLGYSNLQSAMKDFIMGYSDGKGFERIGSIETMTMENFKKWLGEQGALQGAAVQ